MLTRRKFLAGSASAAVVMPLSGCASDAMSAYDRAESQLRSRVSANPDLVDFIRLATLAPSGHNSQPWHFTPHDSGIYLRPDLSRRTRVVDPDDHHLFVSLGCAAENLLIAAAANGRPGAIAFNQEPEDRLDINLAYGAEKSDGLYPAILKSQSTRANYDGKPVSTGNLRLLEATASIPGVSVMLMAESSKRESVLEYLIQGNGIQMGNPAFVEELRNWIRFNPSQALMTCDGLFTRCSGQPAIPAWFGKQAFRHFFKKDAEDARYAQQMRSSAGVAIFIGDKADKDHWIKVGRSFQRFALQATALGIRHSLINQPVEVPSVRTDFARWLGIGEVRPDLVVRFGYAAPMPMSMRRAVSNVIVS
jgi:hypothetical protein